MEPNVRFIDYNETQVQKEKKKSKMRTLLIRLHDLRLCIARISKIQ